MEIHLPSQPSTRTVDRMTFLLSAVGSELGNISPYFEVMGKQLDGALKETETGILAVITRLNAIHAFSTQQDERIQQTLRQCLLIVEVFCQQSEQNKKVVAIVHREIHKHHAELKNHIERARSLSIEVRELQGIVEIIADIASQTKILAINGAIQATHVGQAGAGFRVVALEMKTLSTRTAVAAATITSRISNLSKRMSEELTASEQSAVEVQESSDTLNQVIQDISALELRFQSAIGELRRIIENVHSSNDVLLTQLTEALGHIQFQDVVRQRVEQVTRALQELDEHTRWTIARLADETWDGTFHPTLKERLDHHVAQYVMASQRNTHSGVLGSHTQSQDGPAIELF